MMHEVERICRKRQIDLTFLPRMIGLTEWKASKVCGSLRSRGHNGLFTLFHTAAIFSLETLD